MARLSLPVAVLLSLALAGCSGGVPSRAKATAPTKVASSAEPHPIALAEAQRVVDQVGQAATLTGKVKLISDHGGGIISNNSGAIISEHGGALISNNGGSLTGKTKRTLLQAPDEALLADAQIEVLDGAGHVLVDANHQPLVAKTDAEGNYKLAAVLPAESLVFRVRLYNGGQLLAIVAHDERAEVPIDTASSLGASYVLSTYVQHRQNVFDRLPADAARDLHRDAEVARAALPGVPSYQPADLTKATQDLRALAKPLDLTLLRIESILLAGQKDLGNGQFALAVALAAPQSLAADAQGNIYISEQGAFRIRRVDRVGSIDVFAGIGARTGGSNQTQTLEAVGAIAFGPDGALYATQVLTGQIRRIQPDGTVETFYGPGAGSGPALNHPTSLAFGPDGTLYVGEVKPPDAPSGRLFAIDLTGHGQELPAPPGTNDGGILSGLAVRPDGTLLVAEVNQDVIFSKAPGQDWKPFVTLKGVTKSVRMALGPSGDLYVPMADEHKIVKVAPDGTVSTFAGTGKGGNTGDKGPATQATLGQPAAVLAMPDGVVLISDLDGVVRRVKDGVIDAFAGTRNVIVGDATTIPLNGPGGMALAPDGTLVFSEAGSHTIKRLHNNQIEVVAGTAIGFGGDGGPAEAAQLDNPAGIAYVGPDLYVLDVGNNRIRKIDATGTISTVVHGNAHVAEHDAGPVYAADNAPYDYPLALAAAPDGTIYWSDIKAQQILHLRADGKVEVIAGTWEKPGFDGDGGPAALAHLDTPTGLTFDQAGDLYFSDSHNLCVRKIELARPDRPISLVAGRERVDFLNGLNAALAAGPIPNTNQDGKSALEVSLFGPAGICFDAAGSLYVSELGTSKLASFGGASGIPAELFASLPQAGTRIRRITAGKIYTVAGDGTKVLNDPATDESMLYPFMMLFDAQGRLILADTALDQIKLLKPDVLK
jgi:sugar lactone lactonase YvrE